MAKIQIYYVETQFPLYLWDTPQLRYIYLKVNTRKNTYGTYFSCPSLEISSTSLSRRLSIAMSTSNRVAILKGSDEPLMRTLFIEVLTQWYHGLSSSQRAKTTWRNDSCLRGLALREVSFRQIGSFNPLFQERKLHAVYFSQGFKRFLLFSVPHVENSYVLFWRRSAFGSVQPRGSTLIFFRLLKKF